MVWIHGGGFVGGSGVLQGAAGGPFARQGVVLVTINYRLGRFGFFAFPALTANVLTSPRATTPTWTRSRPCNG